MTDDPTYTTRALGPDAWDDFASLVGANNGVWGGCWCMGFHPEGLDRDASANRDTKRARVERGTVHQILVYADDERVGWCQYGTAADPPNIKNPKAYAKHLGGPPDWRIGCIFTDRSHRGRGVARAAVAAALAAIGEAGGGTVEAYPEQVGGRPPQRGSYLHTGPETLFEEFGFARDRRIAKWRWVMRLTVAARPRPDRGGAVGQTDWAIPPAARNADDGGSSSQPAAPAWEDAMGPVGSGSATRRGRDSGGCRLLVVYS